MGYYVYISESNFRLPKEKFQEAYERMCELNDHDELKNGGAYGGDLPEQTSRYNPNKWFSWMPYNYPEVCKDVISIFDALGFEDLTYNENGDLVDFRYSNKLGSERYFLECLGGLIDNGSYIIWKGEEEDDWYRFIYVDDKCIRQDGLLSISWPESEYAI
jgi:hypothetical protein